MLSPDAQNYLYGKGRTYFRPEASTGYIDLGSIPKFEISIELEKDEHYSSRSGTKEKDLVVILQKKASANFDLEEYSMENLNLAFMADGVHNAVQQAGTVENKEIATTTDRFTNLGVSHISILRIIHTNVASGPFQLGETMTGATSSATGKIAWVGSESVELVEVTGKFTTGETLTGGASSATASASSVEIRADAVVTEKAASPTVRYKPGRDYDIDADAGLIRIRSEGAITSGKSFATFDHAAKTMSIIRPLVNSETRGELLFIGDPDQGPKLKVQCWKTNLSISGAMGLISDSVSAISMQAEFLADRLNHPSDPFFRVMEINR